MTADAVLDAIRIEQGRRFALEGRCHGGEIGAYFARTPEGQRLVFKWFEDPGRLGELTRVVDRVRRLRAAGLPAPLHHPPVPFDGGVAVFQEEVGGRWRDDIGHHLVALILDLNDLQHGLADESEGWRDYIARSLIEGDEGFCLHGTLLEHSAESRRVLGWVRAVGDAVDHLPCDDLVHFDFHHRNLLRLGTRLVAVVDWEGCRPGDRVFDLVTFAFGFTHADADPGSQERVWARAEDLGSPGQLRAYAAYMALRRLDWTIRHHRQGDVDHLLETIRRYRSRTS